jgi:ABC-type multidrug transport system fused ATPase/permease subunit
MNVGFNSSSLKRILGLFSRTDKNKLLIVAAVQIILSFLDLVALAFVGIIGSLGVMGVKGDQPGNRVTAVLDFLNLTGGTLQRQVTVLGLLTALLMVTKTILSAFFLKKSFFFLSRRSAFISQELIRKFLKLNLVSIQKWQHQELLWAINTGANAMTMGILSSLVLLVSDASLLIVLIGGLLIVNFKLALVSSFIFCGMGYILYLTNHKRARKLGSSHSNLNILNAQTIVEVVSSYREAIVRGTREKYSEKISNQRFQIAELSARLMLMPNVSKYYIELTVVIAVLIMGFLQFMSSDAVSAVATLSIFLAASLRIAPAVLRIQQSSIQIKSSLGFATSTFKLMDFLETEPVRKLEKVVEEEVLSDFTPIVSIRDATFTYPGNRSYALDSVDLEILPGETIAIVGSSGAGKTTLIDVLLGGVIPDSGKILINGKTPEMAIRMWPGKIAYVPQSVFIASGSIRENICLGFEPNVFTDQQIFDALEKARLLDFVNSLPAGMDAHIGDRGAGMSGGQQQRLGIARALVTSPELLVLDEATSAMDAMTELEFTQVLASLSGQVTVVMIAHRLSSVRNVSKVVYLESGRVIATGTFDEVAKSVPDFNTQAKLMGL